MEKSDQAPAQARISGSGGSTSAVAKGDESGEEGANIGCGWGRFRPAILAPFAHVWTFIVLYLVFSFTHGVQGSYTISVLTTLERRFKLPSFLAGALVTVSTIGYMASAVFTSFFFAKKNQSRLFAGCMLLTSLCALLYVIPHIIYGTGNDAVDEEHAQRHAHFNSTAPPSEGGSGAVLLCVSDGNEVVGVGGGGGGGGGEEGVESICSAAMKKAADEDVAFVMPAMVLFAASEILQGIAGAPVWTVGLAFIDDHTNPELSAKLIGLMFTVRFVSPMISFAMGGYLLSIYANLKETDLTADHPQWIGAWWLGFLICSIVNFIICIPTSMIPKKLRPIRNKVKTDAEEKEEKEEVEREEKKEEDERMGSGKEKERKEEKEDVERGEKNETDEEKEKERRERRKEKEGTEENLKIKKKEDEEDERDENDGDPKELEEEKEVKTIMADDMKTPFVASTNGSQNSSSRPMKDLSRWKELPKATMRLLTNPIYMLASIAICIDCFILGFMAFLPKYFEVYFQKTASVANLLGGMIPAIFGGCASYVGGLVSGKIKGIDGGVAGLCRMNSTLSLICLICLVPAMFLSCPDVNYSGHLVKDRLNLTTDCNIDCVCSADVFDPVCGSDDSLYFSPCHAGCKRLFNSTTDQNDLSGHRTVRAADCGCVGNVEGKDEGEEEVERGRFVFAGFCEDSCASMIPYVLNLVAIFFSLNMYNVPCTTIILRCIREEDKSFALGLQTFGICLTIFPAPLLYGSVFDASCVLRETKSCTDSEGTCLLYDRQALRFAFHGLTIGLHAIATILYYVTLFLARRKLSLLTAQHKTQLSEMEELKANRLIITGDNSNEA